MEFKRAVSHLKNFMWAGIDQRSRARVSWNTCCRTLKGDGLNLINLKEAEIALLCIKCIISACEPGESALKSMLRY